MNSALNDKRAGKGTGRLARRALQAALACVLVLGASGTALAQQHGERDYGGQPSERHGERFRLPQMDRDPRQSEVPMRGDDDPRRVQPYQPQYQLQYPQYQQPQDPQRHGSRMTADERREMRRQINEAKDLYPRH